MLNDITTLLTEATERGLSFHVSIHTDDNDVVLEWLQRGLLTCVKQGANNGTNPPTGYLMADDTAVASVYGAK